MRFVLVAAACAPLLVTAPVARAQDSTKKTDSVTVQGSAPTLEQVRVSGRVVNVPSRFRDAYKRAAGGRGYYFTAEEIEATNPRDIQSLLERVPAVMINERSLTFQKCQGGMPSPAGGLANAQEAKIGIYVDGRRTTAGDGESALEVLQQILPSSIQLMEVYNGASRIPGEFSQDACAVILIWTKAS